MVPAHLVHIVEHADRTAVAGGFVQGVADVDDVLFGVVGDPRGTGVAGVGTSVPGSLRGPLLRR